MNPQIFDEKLAKKKGRKGDREEEEEEGRHTKSPTHNQEEVDRGKTAFFGTLISQREKEELSPRPSTSLQVKRVVCEVSQD